MLSMKKHLTALTDMVCASVFYGQSATAMAEREESSIAGHDLPCLGQTLRVFLTFTKFALDSSLDTK